MSREHIQAIYRKKFSNDANSTSLAYTMDSVLSNVVRSYSQFIFELLQNADDSIADSVCFQLINNQHVLVSHDGKHFDQQDVERVCDYATHSGIHERNKNRDLSKTGYKGIGFKSLFFISKKITIISNEYCFRFDQNHWTHPDFGQTDEAKYPWQIIPINTDQATIVDIIAGHELDLNKVNILLENIPCIEQVKSSLNELFQLPESLLTLRHIAQISLFENDLSSRLEKKEMTHDAPFPYFELSSKVGSSHPFFQYWYKKEHEIYVSESCRERLREMNDSECPYKIKQAEKVSVSLSARLDKKEHGRWALIPCGLNVNLYCYLPTNVNTGLPFLINADFLLNYNRRDLLDNAWNEFLWYEIGKEQFKWLANIGHIESLMPDMLTILGDSKINNLPVSLQREYQRGWFDGLKEIPFLPSMDKRDLFVRDAIFDKTGFGHHFYSRIDTAPSLDQSCLLSGKLRNVERIQACLTHEQMYTHEKLIDDLEHFLEKLDKKDLYHNLIVEIITYCQRITHKYPQYIEAFKACSFLKVINGVKLLPPSKCYLPSQEHQQALVARFSLPVVVDTIASSISLSWLRDDLSVKLISPLNIIRDYVFSLIQQNKINCENSIDLLLFVYDTWKKNQLLDDDCKQLSLYSVITQSGNLSPIKNVYLRAILPELTPLTISDNYLLRIKLPRPSEEQQWQNFLIALKIQHSFNLLVEKMLPHYEVAKRLRYESEKIYSFFANSYVPYIKNQIRPHVGAGYSMDYELKSLSYSDFIYFNGIGKIANDPSYAYLFWKLIQQDWEVLKKPWAIFYRPYKKNDTRSIEVDHFIVHCIKHFKFILDQNDQLSCASDLFFPFEELNHLPIPFAQLPINLHREQAKFLGFQTRLSSEKWFELIDRASVDKKVNQISILYRYLLRYPYLMEESDVAFEAWRKKSKLLSTNNQLKEITSLIVYDHLGVVPKENQYLHDCGLSIDELKKLASILKLKLYSKQSDRVVFDVVKNSSENSLHLKLSILSYLPALVMIQINENNEEKMKNLLIQTIHRLRLLELVPCHSIRCNDGQDVADYAIWENGQLFYKNFITIDLNSFPLINDLVNLLCENLFHFSDEVKQLFKMYWVSQFTREQINQAIELYSFNRDFLDTLYALCEMEMENFKQSISMLTEKTIKSNTQSSSSSSSSVPSSLQADSDNSLAIISRQKASAPTSSLAVSHSKTTVAVGASSSSNPKAIASQPVVSSHVVSVGQTRPGVASSLAVSHSKTTVAAGVSASSDPKAIASQPVVSSHVVSIGQTRPGVASSLAVSHSKTTVAASVSGSSDSMIASQPVVSTHLVRVVSQARPGAASSLAVSHSKTIIGRDVSFSSDFGQDEQKIRPLSSSFLETTLIKGGSSSSRADSNQRVYQQSKVRVVSDKHDSSDRRETDRLGESMVYQELRTHYTQKYPNAYLTEQENGFEIDGGIDDPSFNLTVTWYNKGLSFSEESSEDHDILVTKKQSNREKIRYFKVASSQSDSRVLFFSKDEISLLREARQSYSVFQVFQLGSSPCIFKIKNPSAFFPQGEGDLLNQAKVDLKSIQLEVIDKNLFKKWPR